MTHKGIKMARHYTFRLALLAFLLPVAAAAANPQDISGSWSVVSTPAWDTCGGQAEKSAYQWILTEQGGQVTIAVQGQTAFPSLSGTFDGNQLLLAGEGKTALGTGLAQVYPSSVFRLSLSKDRSFTGTRLYLGSRNRKGSGTTLCTTAFDVVAKRL